MRQGSKQSTLGLTVLLTALVSMGVLSITLYAPSLPAIADDLQTSSASVQATLGLFLFGFAIAQLICGPLSDRFGRRPVLLVGIVLYILASLACALAPSILALQVGRVLQGMAACCGPVIARAIVRDCFEGSDAVRALAFVGTALAVAPAAAPIIGGQVQVWLGWQWNFVVLALIGATLLALSLRFLPETNRHLLADAMRPGPLLSNYAMLLRNRRYLGCVLVGALLFGGVISYNSLAPFLFVNELGMSPDIYGMTMLFTVTGYALGSFTSGRLIGRMRPRPVILIALTIAFAGAVVLMYLSGTLTVVNLLAPMVVYMFGFGLCVPPSMGAALEPFPRVAGSASAMMGFSQMTSAGIASLAVLPLYDGTAAPLGIATVGLSLLAAVVFIVLVPASQWVSARSEG